MKPLILASAVALFSIGSAGAQSVPSRPLLANVAAVATCEAQLQRLAELNKTLAANYNAEHVRDVCVAKQ